MSTIEPVVATHVPDVLETLAQLPNDEVFTPPWLANGMLDILPAEVWNNPSYRWLDPASKSGVFLREVAKRLMTGLAEWEPDGLKRRAHILKNMLFGAAISELHGDISRRSVYQTKNATGTEVNDVALRNIVVPFEFVDGNIPYVPTEHTLDSAQKLCLICGAPAALVRKQRETYAYSFIHGTYPPEQLLSLIHI